MLKGILVALVMATTAVSAADKEVETIRVLVADAVPNPQVEVTGGYRLFNPATQKFIGSSLKGRRSRVEALQTGLRWGEEYPAVYQISILPRREGNTTIVNGIQYQGNIHLYQVDGRVSIVNEIPVEDYLRFTLTEKFAEPRSAEVMAAVAIAARTSAMHQVDEHWGDLWDVRAESVHYRGGLASSASGAVDQAVTDTQYMILTVGDRPGHTFPAVWTEDCAGRTAPYGLMFGNNGKDLETVAAPLALQHRDAAAWRLAVSKESLARAARLETITNMQLLADGETKKVYAIRLTDGKGVQEISFFRLQAALGSDKLKSSDFTAEMNQGQIVFRGYGEGHGVGLCLFSAQKMARDGSNAAEILAAFYPNAKLQITRESITRSAGFFGRKPAIYGFHMNTSRL